MRPNPAFHSSSTAAPLNSAESASLVVRQRVRAAYFAAFQTAVQQIVSPARTPGGTLSCVMLRPSGAGDEWLLILHFDSVISRQEWEAAAVATGGWVPTAWVKGPPTLERTQGRFECFALPYQPGPLAKWKMAIVTCLALYPLVLWVFPHLAVRTAGLAPWLGKMVTVAVAVPIMTWLALPLILYLLRNWLYPPAPPSPGK